ncbi:ATP-binding protein [Kitasatospora camelliae]|uniref:ATP-binding protein n=1 Tax=Kitasatospora camelliae TaxID=3156397 RepID=A0AAU8JQQ3_9ACTN
MCPSLGPAAFHRRRLGFPAPDAAAGRAGMSFVRRALAGWRLDTPAEAAADAVLVAAELLANAVDHGGGVRSVELELQGQRLRIRVTDANPLPPVLGEHHPEAAHGHGLFIVDRLCLRWGFRPTDSGKTVWADVPLPRSARRAGLVLPT